MKQKAMMVIVASAMLMGVRCAVLKKGDAPANIGLSDGKLAPCPGTPNCVSSQAAGKYPQMNPIAYEGDREKARQTLVEVINGMPRTQILTNSPDYVHATFTSKIWRFVDDVEFHLPPGENLIHFRSASRVGHSDLGVNRKRMEEVARLFESAR